MKAKKNPKHNLNNYSKLFLLLGLVAALLAVEYVIEMKTYYQETATIVEQQIFDGNEEIEIPETKIEIEIPKERAPIVPEPVLERIEIIADDIDVEETVIESTETEVTDAVVIQKIDYSEIEEEEIVEEIVEDVPFFVIEKVPIFPGCTGNKEQLRICMQDKIQQHVAKNFDVSLAQDLGLSPGKKRIFVMFVIDKDGNISAVQSRAPHKRLQKEAERVIKLLPKMKPGEQRGRSVGVKYSLPIVFEVMAY
jgi:protein TonB